MSTHYTLGTVSNQYAEQTVSIAVALIRSRDLRTIQILKRFLTYIPSSTDIKQILTIAVTQLSKTCPETTCWLLQHPEYLQPELNVLDIVVDTLSVKLSSWGFVYNRDFHFDENGKLIMSQSAEVLLFNTAIVDEITVLSIIRSLLKKEV